MNSDHFLDQLAEWEVPPTPAHFDERLHERVNHWLIALQLIDFAVRAVPWALGHFAQALGGALRYSLTGHFDNPPRPRDRRRM